MAYKIKNPYKECHIMDLNMVTVQRKVKVSIAEITLMFAPLIITGLYAAVMMMPELGFLAECQNIPGGDICHISIK